MIEPIRFFVEGKPQPAGSKRAFVLRKGGAYTGKAIVTDANPKAKDWKIDVQHACRSIADRMEGNLLRCPLKIYAHFTLPRPKHHYRTGANAHLLRLDAPLRHVSKPDATKLLRGLEDACTGLLWVDDAQIAEQHVTKQYGDRIGCDVTICELEP